MQIFAYLLYWYVFITQHTETIKGHCRLYVFNIQLDDVKQSKQWANNNF